MGPNCTLIPGPPSALIDTFVLPDGSIVKTIEVKAVRVHSHFWSDKYYVQVELRDGSTRDVVEHLSSDAAHEKKGEIVAVVRDAVDEVQPYECGHQAGFAAGRAEGRSEGFTEGRSQGYQDGLTNGHAEARRSILSAIYQRREAYLQEQEMDLGLPPSKRRYLRNATSVLTDLIQHRLPEDL